MRRLDELRVHTPVKTESFVRLEPGQKLRFTIRETFPEAWLGSLESRPVTIDVLPAR